MINSNGTPIIISNPEINNKSIIELVREEEWDALENTVICQDKNDNITAKFGDIYWDITPYTDSMNEHRKRFNFSELISSPSLLLELKIIVYGWLFHKSTSKHRPMKITSILSRFSSIKSVYLYLMKRGFSSVNALSDQKNWSDFEDMLIEKEYSQNHLNHVFNAFNSIVYLQPWCGIDFNLSIPNAQALALSLSNRREQQTLVIPENISDQIYGKAMKLVEAAYPHRKVIAITESELKKNYLIGEEVLNKKISSGHSLTCVDYNSKTIDKRKFYSAISDHLPQSPKDIMLLHLSSIKEFDMISNARDFRRYYGQLITACYICCGCFTGMRDSELGQLTPNSYYCEAFEGRDFHMLQSKTFKLGEKIETWVAAPIAKKAIELAASLTQEWRDYLTKNSNKYKGTLWVNNIYRSRSPVVISDWPNRLKRFCKQFNIKVTEANYEECIESNPQSKDLINKYIKIGEPWHLTSHQFRRSLAYYMIKHRIGTTLALKQQFKHLYLSMTEWYSNGGRLAHLKLLKIDSHLQELLDITKEEYTTNKIFNMVHSDQPLSGSHGKAIMKMRDDIPHIYSSWDIIYNAVKQKRLTLHGTAHSYCKSGYDCDMDGVANPAFCVDCSSGSSIIDESHAKWWQRKHESLTNYLSTEIDTSPTEYSHCITQIRAAEIVMKDFDIPFTTYKHPIEITEL
ncbi:hypothetical protein [Motilimonas cestriensis]|uniref:Integrase n=1 Tax=Motilimonas cestriensis TaxID=2742685 RepID=A0ABS8WC63_9GAMM|nr:hypothetical protein [Motilimonas cestriensis]MCE2595860.1 hypothetical protein [Motilimonas cestriensis]